MPQPHVKTGLWELYHEPFHKRWIWTLEDTHAFWLLGLYVASLILVQNRVWTILKKLMRIFFRSGSAVRLPEETETSSSRQLFRVSQTEALLNGVNGLGSILRFLKLRVRTSCGYVFLPMREWWTDRRWETLPSAVSDLGRRVIISVASISMRSDVEDPEAAHEYSISPSQSAWLGFLALINGTGCIIIGIFLPFLLTNGVETPTVRSRVTSHCDINRLYGDSWNSNQEYSQSQKIFDQCWDRVNQRFVESTKCPIGLSPKNINITFTPSGQCPPEFGSHCLKANKDNSSQILRIEQRNIVLRDLGLNSPSKQTLTHELLCTPIELEDYIISYNGKPAIHFQNFHDPHRSHEIYEDYEQIGELRLRTFNGPNKWSPEFSGHHMEASYSGPLIPEASIYVGPEPRRVVLYPESNSDPVWPGLSLGRRGAYLVVYLAQPGQSGSKEMYSFVEDDPVFSFRALAAGENLNGADNRSAGTARKRRGLPIVPDKEASAIGCIEKFKICNFPIDAEWNVHHQWITPTRSDEANAASIIEKISKAKRKEESLRIECVALPDYAYPSSSSKIPEKDIKTVDGVFGVYNAKLISPVPLIDTLSVKRNIDSKSKRERNSNRMSSAPLSIFRGPISTLVRGAWKPSVWGEEVMEWYLTSWFYAMERVGSIPTSPLYETSHLPPKGYPSADVNPQPWLEEDYYDSLRWEASTLAKNTWCNGVLLEMAEYTNVNFIGFIVATLGMGLLVLISEFEDAFEALLCWATWGAHRGAGYMGYMLGATGRAIDATILGAWRGLFALTVPAQRQDRGVAVVNIPVDDIRITL